MKTTFQYLVVLAAVLVFSYRQASAQDTAEVSAESLVSETIDGKRINRLVGNVVLQQDQTLLTAQRATEYVDLSEVLFSVDVQIVERGDTLTANSVRYNKVTKIGRAQGDVNLTDGDVLVRAPNAVHYANRKYTRFERGVTLIDSVSTLTSRRGEYYSEMKRAIFYQNVRLQQKGSVTLADSVEFFREDDVADVFGNVFVLRVDDAADGDSSETWLFGDEARTENRLGRNTITGSGLVVQFREDESSSSDAAASDSVDTVAEIDTVAIAAQRLQSIDDDDVERLTAAGAVSIWRANMAALADSASFDKSLSGDGTSREVVRLFSSPILWFEDTQISGDSIRILLVDGKLDSLYVDGSAFLAQADTTTGNIHQVKGGNLRGSIREGGDRILRFAPDAEAIYYLVEDDETSGATKTTSDSIVMTFAGDSLRQVAVLGNVDGTFYDKSIIPSSLQLDGYSWMPTSRPSRLMFASDPRFVKRKELSAGR